MQIGKTFLNLRTTITLLVCGVVALSLFVADILISSRVADLTQSNQENKAMDIARMVAHTPLVIEALGGQRAERDIQAFANEIRQVTHVEFIVVMDMHGIRKSHPDEKKVGQPFVGGDQGSVLAGKEHFSVAQGTMGPSMRAFTPVYSADHKQIGAVAVGISLSNVEDAVARSRSGIYAGIGLGVLVGVAGAFALAGRVKNIIFGMEPIEIATLLEERNALLQSVREGIVAVDHNNRVTLVNAEATRLFKRAGIDEDFIGKAAGEFLPDLRLKNVLSTGRAELNKEQEQGGITLLVNCIPIYVAGKLTGAVSTFRDMTEIRKLAEELTGVRLYAGALRAQSHEFMNKLHVILGMVHMKNYEQLKTYINQVADHHQKELDFIVSQIKDPVLAGFLLGKLSYAREAGVELRIAGQGPLPEAKQPGFVHEVVTVLGNLVDNAIEAVADCPVKSIDVAIQYQRGLLTLEVSDTGAGMNDELIRQVYEQGFSTKGEGRGIGMFLVQRSLKRINGTIDLFSLEGEGTSFTVTIPYQGKDEHND